ncbi:MAG: radical SAM protein [Elusimicrobia bacterium]|nr:radical SAM protein [Elusimicrobiota bacterium]
MQDIKKTYTSKKKGLSKRILFSIGEQCNMNCRFCFYRFLGERKFKKVREAEAEILRLMEGYACSDIDITGGEPTVYPELMEILEFCSRAGLKPSIVTNGQRLADIGYCKRLKKAGIEDVLLSLHGTRSSHDYMSNNPSAFSKIELAVDNLVTTGIPFRVNTVITKLNYTDVPDMVGIVSRFNPVCFNLIAFLPIGSWDDRSRGEADELIVRYSEAAPYVKKAIDRLEENGCRHINARFFPFCTMKDYEKYVCNIAQIPYDVYHYDFSSWLDAPDIKKESEYAEMSHQLNMQENTLSDTCLECDISAVCGGINRKLYEYNAGCEEAYKMGRKIEEPLFFKERKV